MVLDDFSSLLGLAATFYLAFAAIEYVKSFSALVYEKLFKLPSFISVRMRKANEMIIDSESLKNLSYHEIDGKSILDTLEKIKRTNELLIKNIRDIEEKYANKFKSSCVAKDIQCLSIFLFLLCVIAMFLAGMQKQFYEQVKWIWVLYAGLSYIYLLVAALLQNRVTWIANFRTMFVVCLITLFVSIGGGILFHKAVCINEALWMVLLPTSVALVWLSFLTFFITIKVQIDRTKNELVKELNELTTNNAYTKMLSMYNSLISLQELALD